MRRQVKEVDSLAEAISRETNLGRASLKTPEIEQVKETVELRNRTSQEEGLAPALGKSGGKPLFLTCSMQSHLGFQGFPRRQRRRIPRAEFLIPLRQRVA